MSAADRRHLLPLLIFYIFASTFFIASDTVREGTIQPRSKLTATHARLPGNSNNSNDDKEDNDDVVIVSPETTKSCFVPNLSGVTTTQRPLPTPVIVVGLPKTGTTSLTAWFRDAEYKASHWECRWRKKEDNGRGMSGNLVSNRITQYCGTCIDYAIKRGLSPLKYCGNYQFWGQLDVEMPQFGMCAFPQVYNLPELHEENPNATLILNHRNITRWIDSLRHWGDMAQRFMKCGLLNSTDIEDLEDLYCSQIDRVREFVRHHPSHALVEVDIEDDATGETLAALFGGNASLWKQENKWKDKGTEKPETPETQTPSSCLVPNLNSVTSTRRPLPAPIIVVGMPKAGTSSVRAFFRNAGYTTSHYFCRRWKNKGNKGKIGFFKDLCGPCIDNAVQIGEPPLKSCGNYQFWGQIDVAIPHRNICYFPQINNLGQIHAEHPNATFILNQRNVTNWINSSTRWGNMTERFVQCKFINSTDHMEDFYCSQINRVRDFVRKHPSHALVEIDIEDKSAGLLLAELFSTNASFWGHENAAAIVE